LPWTKAGVAVAAKREVELRPRARVARRGNFLKREAEASRKEVRGVKEKKEEEEGAGLGLSENVIEFIIIIITIITRQRN
jgi:hypothetical protein